MDQIELVSDKLKEILNQLCPELPVDLGSGLLYTCQCDW